MITVDFKPHRNGIIRPNINRPRRLSHIPLCSERLPTRLSRTPVPPLQICKVHPILGPKNQGNEDDYEFRGSLGQGAYAVVRKALNKRTGNLVAIKTYEKQRMLDIRKKRNLISEVKILRSVDHPNIVKLLEVIETDSQVHLVMEYVSGCSLGAFLKHKPSRKIEDAELKNTFNQILSAVQYCHSKNISHRDLKLDNIIITCNKTVKLIDFGFSTMNLRSGDRCGTPRYMAPEIFQNKAYESLPADVWALGVILYKIANGFYPFKGSSKRDLYNKITTGLYAQSKSLETVNNILKKMLTVNPIRRINASQVVI